MFNRLIKHLDSTRQHWSTVFLEASPHTKPFSLKCSKQQQNKCGQDAGLQLVEAQLADTVSTLLSIKADVALTLGLNSVIKHRSFTCQAVNISC